MRIVSLSLLMLVLTACTERQVTDVYWLNEEKTFSIEIVTEPQQPDAVGYRNHGKSSFKNMQSIRTATCDVFLHKKKNGQQ